MYLQHEKSWQNDDVDDNNIDDDPLCAVEEPNGGR